MRKIIMNIDLDGDAPLFYPGHWDETQESPDIKDVSH